MKQKQIKYCDLELKDLNDEKGIVAFYFASFNTKDADGDVIMPTAFEKTFSESKARIKHFRNHNSNEVPGTVIELGTDKKGAYAVSKLALKTAVGKDTYEQYKAGIINEHSFGYQTIKFDKSESGRTLKELKLHEVSSLTHWGMNENTPTLSVKSIEEIQAHMEKLNIMLSSAELSEEKAKGIIAEYDKLSEIILTLKSKPVIEEIIPPAIDWGYLVKNFSVSK
jgi:hypothetical protein